MRCPFTLWLKNTQNPTDCMFSNEIFFSIIDNKFIF